MIRTLTAGLMAVAVCYSSAAADRHIHTEKEYQAAWCGEREGIEEYRLDDGARVDCLFPEYAVEFDFAPKWAESVGQSLYYGLRTGRQAAIVLIMEHPSDAKFLKRLRAVADPLGIQIWTMTEPDQKSIDARNISITNTQFSREKVGRSPHR